eukprot:TRINITY_DN121278_c0_g1_i1.p1 TRINITY_DN121278_c0_g1~~TRINITY_DN121278_c0_g1_i1.p1  ORF type:complete len:233 (+),score=32.79 TRINITY_DN121278_c0_g1_i1:110-808(+)
MGVAASPAACLSAVLVLSLASSPCASAASSSKAPEPVPPDNATDVEPVDLLSWPHCLENSTAVWRLTPLLPSNADQALYANVQAFGAVTGCYQNDCLHSDKFAASRMESCAQICLSLPTCTYWMWGKEVDDILPPTPKDGKILAITKTQPLTKCWLRLSDAGREENVTGWTSAAKTCHPPGLETLVPGNRACWMQDFDYSVCCDIRHGPGGNPSCWDDMFHYDKCCLPEVVL